MAEEDVNQLRKIMSSAVARVVKIEETLLKFQEQSDTSTSIDPSALANKMANLETAVKGHQQAISSLRERLGNSGPVSSSDGANSSSGDSGALLSSLLALTERVGKLEATSSAPAKPSASNADLTALQARLSKLEKEAADAQATQQKLVLALTERVGKLEQGGGAVAAAPSGASDSSERIAKLEAENKALKDQVAKLQKEQASLLALTDRVAKLEHSDAPSAARQSSSKSLTPSSSQASQERTSPVLVEKEAPKPPPASAAEEDAKPKLSGSSRVIPSTLGAQPTASQPSSQPPSQPSSPRAAEASAQKEEDNVASKLAEATSGVGGPLASVKKGVPRKGGTRRPPTKKVGELTEGIAVADDSGDLDTAADAAPEGPSADAAQPPPPPVDGDKAGEATHTDATASASESSDGAGSSRNASGKAPQLRGMGFGNLPGMGEALAKRRASTANVQDIADVQAALKSSSGASSPAPASPALPPKPSAVALKSTAKDPAKAAAKDPAKETPVKAAPPKDIAKDPAKEAARKSVTESAASAPPPPAAAAAATPEPAKAPEIPEKDAAKGLFGVLKRRSTAGPASPDIRRASEPSAPAADLVAAAGPHLLKKAPAKGVPPPTK